MTAAASRAAASVRSSVSRVASRSTSAASVGDRRVELGDALVVAVELDEAQPAVAPELEHVVERAAVPPDERGEHGAALLHDLELARAVGVEPGEVAGELGRGVGERGSRRS